MYQAGIVIADILARARQAKAGADASGTSSVVGGAMGASSSLAASGVERVGRHRAASRLPRACPG